MRLSVIIAQQEDISADEVTWLEATAVLLITWFWLLSHLITGVIQLRSDSNEPPAGLSYRKCMVAMDVKTIRINKTI